MKTAPKKTTKTLRDTDIVTRTSAEPTKPQRLAIRSKVRAGGRNPSNANNNANNGEGM